VRRYYPPKIPQGSHTRNFQLLNYEEKRDNVKRLLASGVRERAVALLTGLSIDDVRRMAAPQ
jgi:hypothetical protein